MTASAMELVLGALYLIVVANLAQRCDVEVTQRSAGIPRWLSEAIWSMLIVFWPVTVPVGWLLRWCFGETKA